METRYPDLLDRIKAAVIDSVVLIAFMLLASSIFSSFENVPNAARIGAFVFIFFLYDPIFTSFFGGTIGHILLGIRVKRFNNRERNITFLFAIIRFAVKAFLGWISFITIMSQTKKRAIHDFAAQSIVVYHKERR